MPSRAERTAATSRSRASLTTRGSSVLAAAAAAAIGAVALGETDLLRVAIIVLLVCIASYVIAYTLPTKIQTHHVLRPVEAPVGDTITVRVNTRIRRALMPATFVCQDNTSEHLLPTHHLAVVSERAHNGIQLAFETAARTRGAHRIGPLNIELRDPLGLVQSQRSGTEYVTALAYPRYYRVHADWLRASATTPQVSDVAAANGVEGTPDIGIREHRPEDGLSRIHWRTSARIGRLMTRLDEPQSELSATIAYESRASMHRTLSFETTLEVVASLGIALIERGYNLRLVNSDGDCWPGHHAWEIGSLLRYLALAAPTTNDHAPPYTRTSGPNILVCTAPPSDDTVKVNQVFVVGSRSNDVAHRAEITYINSSQPADTVLGQAPRSQEVSA